MNDKNTTTPTIITVDEYRSFQAGANAPTRSEDITSAINLTFIQLNGICNNQIRLRWEITDANNKLFLSDDKKQCIKDAFLLQTKYNLDYDNDTSEGTMQGSWGSNSQSITRPKRDKISQDVLNLLTDAGVYLQFTTQTIKTPATSGVKGANWRCEFDSYITLEEADQKYVPRYSPFEVSSTRLFCYDNNRNWTTIGLDEIGIEVLDNYYTKPEIDEKFIDYYNIDAIDELLFLKQDKLPEYVNNKYLKVIDGELAWEDAEATIEWSEILNKPNLYTTSQVDALLNAKQNRLTAGTNINISQVGDELVISATTEPVSAFAFRDLTGSPTDNQALAQALNSKANATEVELKQDITDNTLETTSKTIVGAINELNAKPIPTTYLKSASVSGNTLTLTKQDDTTTTYAPTIPEQTHLYKHNIYIETNTSWEDQNIILNFAILSNSSEQLNTLEKIWNKLNGTSTGQYGNSYNCVSCGYIKYFDSIWSSKSHYNIVGVSKTQSTSPVVRFIETNYLLDNINMGNNRIMVDIDTPITIKDTVTQIF